MQFKVTKLNNAIKVGDKIPMTQYNGNVGRWIEDRLEDLGYVINRGYGPDLLQMGVEIKSRLESSTSGHTMAAMHPDDIVDTEWEDSNIFAKSQIQYRVYYDDDSVVTCAEIFNFTDPGIQALLKNSYNKGRKLLANTDKNYNRGEDCIAYFEGQANGYYQFRVTPAGMKRIEKMSKQKTFSKLFEDF